MWQEVLEEGMALMVRVERFLPDRLLVSLSGKLVQGHKVVLFLIMGRLQVALEITHVPILRGTGELAEFRGRMEVWALEGTMAKF
jgi:hypothetical protein